MLTDPTNPKQQSKKSFSLAQITEKIFKLSPSYLFWGMGSVGLLILGGSLAHSYYLVQNQIAPLVEKELADFMNRPVKIGQIQQVSLNHIRFGPSELKATPTDGDRVFLAALEIGFNPWEWFLTRKLNLEITAVQPKIYLEQGKKGNWLLTPLDKLDLDYPLQINRLRLEKAEIKLVTRNAKEKFKPPVFAYLHQGKLEIQNQSQQIGFQLQGNLGKKLKNNQFKLNGSHDLAKIATNLSIRANNLDVADLNNLLNLPIALNQGNLDTNLDIQVRKQRLTSLQGTASLRDGTTTLAVIPQPLKNIQGIVRFQGTKISFDELNANFGAISTQTQGYVDFQKDYNLTILTKSTAIAEVIKTFQFPQPQIALKGSIESKIRVKGQLSRPQITVSLKNSEKSLIQLDKFIFKAINTDLVLNNDNIKIFQLNAILQQGGNLKGEGIITGQIQSTGKVIANKFQFNLQGLQLPIQAISQNYPHKLPISLISGETQISGKWGQPQSFKAIASLRMPIASGILKSQNLSYQGGNWGGNVQIAGVNLAQLPIPMQSKFRRGNLTGDFQIQGQNQDLAQLQIFGQATLAIAGGEIQAKKFILLKNQWQANLIAEKINLSLILPHISPHRMTGSAQLTGSLAKPWHQFEGKGQAKIDLPHGQIQATKIIFDAQHFRVALSAQLIALNRFNSTLKGNLDGKINIQGDFNQWQPKNLQAEGKIDLSQGLPGLERSLKTHFQWQNDRLLLEKVTATDFWAKGSAIANLGDLFRPHFSLNLIKAVDLQVAIKGLDLKQFSGSEPLKMFKYRGKVDFDGIIRGPLQNPDIQGNLGLTNLQIANIVFAPQLKGNINKIAAKGLNLQLMGKKDSLDLSLDSQYQPISLNLKQKNMQVTGLRDQNLLFITAQQVPLKLLKDLAFQSFPIASRPYSLKNLTSLTGDLSGNFAINLTDSSILGRKVAIDRPRFGTLSGDRVTGDLDYNQGVLTVNNSQLLLKNRNYPFQGNITLKGNNLHFKSEIILPESNIQDILEDLHIFRLDDLKRGLKLPVYSRAADLYAIKSDKSRPLAEVGSPQSSIHKQLGYLAEINARLQQQRQQKAENLTLPDLASLEGGIAGKLAIQGELGGKIETAFNFTGKNWHWADLKVDSLQLQGNWQNDTLTLEPLRLQTGNSFFVLTGKVGKESQVGELNLVNIPLKPFTSLIILPKNLELDGSLSATISLMGNRANPQAKGNLQINNAIFNQTNLQATEGNFVYQQGRFDFAINSVLQRKTEPLILAGSIPYVFPFASMQPDSDRFNLSLKAKNEGLSLLTLATKGEFSWLSGKGEVQLDVFGKIDPQTQIVNETQAEGNVIIENATIAAQVLPDAPLTQVNGIVHLDLNKLDIRALTGQLSNGNFAIAGSLPLFQPLANINPLTITFENSAFKLKEFYQGGIKSNIQITGSAIEPDISGTLDLFKGKIMLGEALPNLENGGELNQRAEFQGFKLNLGENVRIQNSPIVDFLATGSVILNGTFNQLLPEGTIFLKSGQINLFASQLRLSGGDENVAQFSPHRGLDPYLNLRLISAATETSRNTLNANPLSSEINEPFSANSESLQMIRIQALVQGYASQLTNSIQLSSSPSRSQKEIIALLGGGFVNNLGQENSTVGLVDLAGSAVLGGVQGQIGEALGLSQFRIFPTPLMNDEKTTTSNQLGVAAEAGVDLSNDLSISIQKIINTEQLPQWGLRYRLNENTTIRGSSNFADDSRGIVEYEQRF